MAGSQHVGPIVFSDSTARSQLLNHGQVVTFRKDERTTGDTWWRKSRTGEKMGDCRVREIGHVNPSDDSHLRVFQPHSGFRSVESWQDAIKRLNGGEMPEDGVLYHVEAVEDECGKCGEVGYLPTNTFCPPCSREEAVRPDGGTEDPGTEQLTAEEIESRPHPSKMDNEDIWEESDELVEVHREISGGHLNDLINERWGKMLTVLEHRIDPDYPECPHCESTSSVGYAEDGVVVCQSCYETLPEDVREQYREEYSRVWGGIDSDEGGESDGS